MKLLLLTDIPPCKNYTAGIVLDQLCRFLPQGSLVCFAIMSPAVSAKLSDDLNWIPINYQVKPSESGLRLLPGKLGVLTSFPAAIWRHLKAIGRLRKQASDFGRKHKVDAVWAILQGQTVISLARRVARDLGVPLYTQVWDPFVWWLKDNRIDRYSRRFLLKEFRATLEESTACAAASWNMADDYVNTYGTRSLPVISSLDKSWAINPETHAPKQNRDFVIGFAGQFYASAEWGALLYTLQLANWKIGDRTVRIKACGPGIAVTAQGPANIEYFGWHGQKQVIELLSECDMLYCSYWFSSQYYEEARLSFPSKLITYFATGRPVFFHGPEYASPAKYLRENGCALGCYSLEPHDIYNQLSVMSCDADLCKRLAINGSEAFHRDFTLEAMKTSFFKFLEFRDV